MDMNKLMGFFFVFLGLWLFVFNKQHAVRTANIYFKLLHVHFSEKGYRFCYIIGGIIFFIFGLMAVSGNLQFK